MGIKTELEHLGVENLIEEEDGESKVQVMEIWMVDGKPRLFFISPFENPVIAWGNLITDITMHVAEALSRELQAPKAEIITALGNILVQELEAPSADYFLFEKDEEMDS